MSAASVFQLFIATIHGFLALIWATAAWHWWHSRLARADHRVFVILTALGGAGTVFNIRLAIHQLIPRWIQDAQPGWFLGLIIAGDWSLIALAALAWHATHFWTVPMQPPSRWGLILNYSLAIALGLLTLFFPLILPGKTIGDQIGNYIALRNVCYTVWFGRTAWTMAMAARKGGWRPGMGAAVARQADVIIFAGVLIAVGVLSVLVALFGLPLSRPRWVVVFDAIIATVLTIPVAVRLLGRVLRVVLLAAGLLALASAVYVGALLLEPRFLAADLGLLGHGLALATLILVLVPGRTWLESAIERLVSRRRQRTWDELQGFLATLSPEIGVVECCRRALAEVVRLRGLGGAAIILGGGDAVAVGNIAIEKLRQVWDTAATERLPPLDFSQHLPPPPLFAAVIECDVTGVVGIDSPRRRWGHLFVTSGLVAGIRTDEADVALADFARQLALVLDVAELLARAVAVERSLAHSEKLAAIGELAARVAHEIRNPVTAARSLAQQLVREPDSPFQEEHALILMELERVERQVAALLRFSRREELQLASFDLTELVHSTLRDLRPRLDEANVDLEIDVRPSVTTRGDREKLRQVIVNLVENARDALVSSPEARRLSILLSGSNGTATLVIRDNGPGAPADALPRLFEPFFSLKEHGTGLGLAIVKRTIEAHGGSITAAPAGDRGLALQIELPLAPRV